MKDRVVSAAQKRVLYLPHAVKQMSRPDRMIEPQEVLNAVLGGEVIEAYPEDPRGESCLILFNGPRRPIHVVCSPKTDYLAIITAYQPAADQWSADYKTRI